MRSMVALSLAGILVSTAWAEEGSKPVQKVSQIASWLSGTWVGELHGSRIEEIWSQDHANHMIGMFRSLKNGQELFLEFITLMQDGKDPVMRIRHFSQGLKAWEDKDGAMVFRLVQEEANKAVFEKDPETRLTYHRQGDTLHIRLEKQKDGKSSGTHFTFKRVKELSGGRSLPQ